MGEWARDTGQELVENAIVKEGCVSILCSTVCCGDDILCGIHRWWKNSTGETNSDPGTFLKRTYSDCFGGIFCGIEIDRMDWLRGLKTPCILDSGHLDVWLMETCSCEDVRVW